MIRIHQYNRMIFMNPLFLSIAITLASILISFFYGLITRNYSTVDRLWSVLPPLYAIIWLTEFYQNPRYILAAVLVILWGIRLSWNFGRKGGYNFSFKKGFTEEDYRWPIMRRKIPNRFLFELFNFFFICIFQLSLIFAFSYPLYLLGSISGPFHWVEIILFSLYLGFLLLETTADIQQFDYYKKRGNPAYADHKRIQLGFNTFGLWKISRHPNYIGEMGQWLMLYLILAFNLGQLHWSGIGALVLICLFVGSSILAESITREKYKSYPDWQKASSFWLPFWLILPEKLKRRREFFKKLAE